LWETPDSVLNLIRARVPEHMPSPTQMNQAQAAVLMAITDSPQQPELVLTQRATHLSSHAGEVAFPGGKRDDIDAGPVETALRESEEEIALPPAEVEVVGAMPMSVSKMGLQVVPIVGIIPHRISLTPSEAEIETLFRVPMNFFLEQPPLDYTEREFQGVTYRVPCFHFDGHVIWGLTAFFITDFCNRVFDAGFDFFEPRPIRTTRGDAS